MKDVTRLRGSALVLAAFVSSIGVLLARPVSADDVWPDMCTLASVACFALEEATCEGGPTLVCRTALRLRGRPATFCTGVLSLACSFAFETLDACEFAVNTVLDCAPAPVSAPSHVASAPRRVYGASQRQPTGAAPAGTSSRVAATQPDPDGLYSANIRALPHYPDGAIVARLENATPLEIQAEVCGVDGYRWALVEYGDVIDLTTNRVVSGEGWVVRYLITPTVDEEQRCCGNSWYVRSHGCCNAFSRAAACN